MKSEPSKKVFVKRKNVGDHLSFSEKRIHRVSAEIRCLEQKGFIYTLSARPVYPPVADFRIELICVFVLVTGAGLGSLSDSRVSAFPRSVF